MRFQATTATLVLCVLFAASLPAQSSQDDWWPTDVTASEDFRDGFNLRMPLRVGPAPQAGFVAGTPVQVHLDLAKAALDAGWIRDGDRPASFTLDPDSLRLVRYTSGWQSIQSDDPIPVTVHEGWLEPDQRDILGRIQVNPFHERTDPVVTVEWRLEADLPAFQSAHYYLHFDVVENCEDLECSRTPVDPTAQAKESLDGLYWAGKGTRLFGHHPAGTGSVATLMVIGTEDDTTAWVHTYGAGNFPILDAKGFNPVANGFSLDSGQVQPWSFTNTRADKSVHFMVEADRPVIAVTQSGRGSGEFVPSADGGLSGTRFTIPQGTGAVHIIAPTLPGDVPDTEVSFTTTNMVHAQNCPSNTVRPMETIFWCVFTRQDTQAPATVTVQEGGHPLLVQHDHEQNRETTWSQAPSIHGGPVGQEFLALTRPTTEGGFVLSSLAGSQVHVNDCSTFPCRTGAPFTNPPQRIYTVPAAGAGVGVTGQGMFSQAQWQGMPAPPPQGAIQASTPPIALQTDPTLETGDFRVLHGERDAGPAASQTTPFGGAAGREFTVRSPFVIHAFYEGTHIEIDHDGGTRSTDLSETQAFAVCSDPDTRRCHLQQDDGTWGTLMADKPVSVFPLGDPGDDYRRYLSAAPLFQEPRVEAGSYRGYLIDVRPEHGQSPVFVEVLRGGETVRIPFVVENKGRWNDGLLPDTVSFQASSSDPAVAGNPVFKQQNILLNQGGPVLTHVDVNIPHGAPAGSKATLKIEGRSEGNENMVRGFSAVVFLRPHFDVDLLWDDNNAKQDSAALPPADGPGEFVELPFTLRNTGTTLDSFDLALTGLRGGWDAEFRLGGQPVTRVDDVPAGEPVRLDLRLFVPQTRDLSSFIDITATSKQQATATDMIRLNARISFGQEVEMDAPDPILEALPGETVRFLAAVRNTGGDPVTLRFDLVEALPLGWVAALDPSFEDEPLTITPGNQETVPIDITVADDAPADALGTVLLLAEGTDDPEVGGGVALAVQVKKVQDLTVEGPTTMDGDPGQLVQIPLTISNDGNAAEDIRWSALLPGGWNTTLPPLSTILPADSEEHVIKITPPSDALSGDTSIKITARSDGFTASHDVVFHVKELHDLAWQPTPQVVARPEETIQVNTLLTNQGNTDETVTVTASPSSPGGLLEVTPQTLEIPARASRVIAVEWTVPEGASQESIISLTAQAAGVTATQKIDVRVVTPSLILKDIILPDSVPGPSDVAFVTAIFHNPSDAATTGIEVNLVSGNVALDGVRFGSIGPNGTVVAPLRWVGQEDAIMPELTWGRQDGSGFVEIGRQRLDAGNEASTDGVATPAPPASLLLAALGLLVFITKRRHGP